MDPPIYEEAPYCRPLPVHPEWVATYKGSKEGIPRFTVLTFLQHDGNGKIVPGRDGANGVNIEKAMAVTLHTFNGTTVKDWQILPQPRPRE